MSRIFMSCNFMSGIYQSTRKILGKILGTPMTACVIHHERPYSHMNN